MKIIDITYTASSGHTYHLQADGIRVRTANFHKWDYTPQGSKYQQLFVVKKFKRPAAEYDMTLILSGPLATRKAQIKALHEDFEADLRNMTPGRITWGDYYLDCYVTSSSTYPDRGDWRTVNDITIYAPNPFWVKEVHIDGSAVFYPETPRESAYFVTLHGSDDTWYPNFRVYNFEGHSYDEKEYDLRIAFPSRSLGEGDTITIDARKKTVVKKDAQGVETNFFYAASRIPFWRIPKPPGSHYMTISGTGADITIYEERSEPLWT